MNCPINTTYAFSPKTLAFYLTALYASYVKANSWPEDIIGISDAVWHEFAVSAAPAGQKLGVSDGQPAWIAID